MNTENFKKEKHDGVFYINHLHLRWIQTFTFSSLGK